MNQLPRSKKQLLRSSARDVQLHAAVTICEHKDNTLVIGEKSLEISQLCVQLDAKHAPFKEAQVRAAYAALAHHAIEKLRSAGYIR